MTRTKAFVLSSAVLLTACSASSDADYDSDTATADIVNGQDVAIESAPWQVAIEVQDGSAPMYHRCGGVILSRTWVLTAHHCLAGQTSPNIFMVVAGNANLMNYDDPAEQRSYVDRSFPYGLPSIPSPVLRRASTDVDRTHDIELLHLTHPLDLSGPKVRAIPIVDAAGVEAGLTNPGVEGFVTGFGEQTYMRYALKLQGGPTTILTNAAAEEVFHAFPQPVDPDGWDYRTLVLSPGEIATGGTGARHCHGDSGGPLTVPTPGGGRALAGIVSWSPTCDDPKVPGVFARVSEFAPWIKDTMAAHDASLARAEEAAAAVGDATSRALDERTACKLVEAYVFGEGHEDVRGYQVDLGSFECAGPVTTRASSAGDIATASVARVAFKTREPSPRSFELKACLTHPRDDGLAWWTSKLTTGVCP